MLLDVVALGILLLFASIGAWRGLIASASGLVALVLGYVAAIVAGRLYGASVAESLGVPALLGGPAAGALAFAGVYFFCGVVSALLRAWDRRRRAGEPRSTSDRLGGAMFGLLRGGLVVLLLGWLALWLDAARELSGGERFAAAPATANSAVAGATGALVESAVEAALDGQPGSAVAARMAARPGETLRAAQGLIEDDRIRAVQDDGLFWTYVEHGAVDSALNRRSFWNLVNDAELREQLADLGVIGEDAASDPRAFRAEAAEVLEELGPRIKGLAQDPEIRKLAEDPEILALLENGDTLALVSHPDIQNVVSRLSNDR